MFWTQAFGELLAGNPRVLAEPTARDGQFRVRISPEVAPGLDAVKTPARGRFGLSNPRAFLVCHAPVQSIDQEHSRPQNSIELSLQQIVLDRCRPQQLNYYRFRLCASEHLHVAAFARQLDSRAIISVTLHDQQGHELQRSRTVGAFGAEIDYTAPADAEYLLSVNDFLFQGGDDYGYALQATAHPAGEGGFPPCELERLLEPSFDLAIDAANTLRSSAGRRV